MNTIFKTLVLGIAFLFNMHASGQTNQVLALEKGKEAVRLMDKGEFDQSMDLLKEAIKLDPDNFNYPYEYAYAHYLKKDYKGAIKVMNKYKNHPGVSPNLYQLIGNSYDYLGKPDKALKAYDEGLEKFPNSGKLYLEKGNIFWIKKEYGKALPWYEKGIEVEPDFASNYYRAARIFCSSSEEVWGMIYGEIFMNLERNSARTSEISKLLFDTYKSEITITNDTAYAISFSKNATITLSDISDPGNIKLPYGMAVYEMTLGTCVVGYKAIDLNSLDVIRSRFVDAYFKNGNDKKYPNVLFSYQKKVKEAGHMEAYNHWVLMKGDEEAFKLWKTANKDKWDAFVTWFGENGMSIDSSNVFYRSQY